MKLLLKIILLLFIVNSGNAQIPVGNFTVNGKTFIAAVNSQTFSNGIRMTPNTMNIFLVNGSLLNPVTSPTTPSECSKAMLLGRNNPNKADFIRYFNILRSVFSQARCTAIINNDMPITSAATGIITNFEIDASGIVRDVTFRITENSIITPQEIELLHTRLMTQMSFTTTPKNCPSHARFIITDLSDDIGDLNIIHTSPYYFGLGPRWAKF